MPKFWEYLPEQTYRDWQANDFVQEQVNRINEVESSLDEIIPPEPFIGEVPEQVSGQIIEGAPFGGVFGKIKDKLKPRNPLTKTAETFEDIWGVSTDAVTSALDWEQENIADPFAGYSERLGGGDTIFSYPKNIMAVQEDLNPMNRAGRIARDVVTGNVGVDTFKPAFLDAITDPIKRAKKAWETGPALTDYEGQGQYFRDLDISGAERFGQSVLTDPTTFIGGYGKAVSKAPGLLKAGKALSAIEGAPGKAVGGALSKTAETAKSVPWLNKLLEPSTGALARQAGDRAHEAARFALDDMAGDLGGFAGNDPAAVQRFRDLIKGGPKQFSLFPEDAVARMAQKDVMSALPKIESIPAAAPFDDSARQLTLGEAQIPQGVGLGNNPIIAKLRERFPTILQDNAPKNLQYEMPGFASSGGQASSRVTPLVEGFTIPKRQSVPVFPHPAPAQRDLDTLLGVKNRGLDTSAWDDDLQRSLMEAFGLVDEDETFRGAMDASSGLKGAINRAQTPTEFAQAVREAATGMTRKEIHTGITDERAGRTGWGKLMGQAQNAGDKVAGAIAKPTRALATAALGTVGYPLGVGVEDVARSALAGHAGTMQADEAAESLKGVRGMPSWMFQRTGDTSASASLGGNPKHMGPKVGVGSKEFYPGDVLSGKAFRDKAGQISEPIRRDFVAQEYKAAFDDLVAKGASPDQAAVEAAQSAVSRMEQVFPGFAPESKLDAGMQSVVPFWRYQSSHTPYLARTFAERPGLAPTYDKYLEGTDGGNIRIPGGPLGDDISINPLAGSTYNRINQMSKPDFPPYTGGLSGDIEQGLDKLGRTTGLYPGLPVELAQLGIRASEGQPLQLGELIPSPAMVLPQAAAALGTIPGAGNLPGIEQISDLGAGISNMAPDRFRDYAVALQLAANGVSPDEATPQQTEDARKQVALQQFAQTETNVARFRPPEKAQYDDAVKQAALDAGIPKDVVDKAIGDPLGAINPDTGQPYLNTVQKRAIYEANPEWENWRQASTPLKSPADQQRIGSTRAYYKKLDAISADTETQLATYAQAVKEGRMSGADYRNARGDVMSKAAARREQAKADHPEAQITKPDELGSVRPEDYAAQQYYDIQAQRGTDGQLDFDTFTKQREGVLAGMDEATRNYVLNEYRRKFQNPDVQAMEDRFKGVQGKYQEYLKIPKYTGLDPEITAAVEDASRQLRALTAAGMPYKLALAELLDAGHPGAALVKATSKLVNPARKQYLAANPDLIWMLHDVLGPTIEAAGIGLN